MKKKPLNKLQKVIKRFARDKLPKYSFVISNKKHLTVQAETFENALAKVLSLHNSKVVRYNLINALKQTQQPMDLMSARKKAATQSKSTKKKVYIICKDDGEHFLATAPFPGKVATFENGEEVHKEKPTAPVEPIDNKVLKELKAEIVNDEKIKIKKETSAPAKKEEKENKKVMATTAKKSPAKKVSSTPAKKEAAKPSNGVSKATTVTLTPTQWKKLEALGAVRQLVNEALIKQYKL
jgi:hypothetical protein